MRTRPPPSITPTGTALVYCFTVRNTGNVTLTQQSLVDDRLGTLLDKDMFSLETATRNPSRKPGTF